MKKRRRRGGGGKKKKKKDDAVEEKRSRRRKRERKTESDLFLGTVSHFFVVWQVGNLQSSAAGWTRKRADCSSYSKSNAIQLLGYRYNQRNVTQVTPEVPAHSCLLQYYSQ
jgi:hypothetical protein